jgi:hypothetical protein
MEMFGFNVLFAQTPMQLIIVASHCQRESPACSLAARLRATRYRLLL